MLDKIVFTGDLLRTSELCDPNQILNVRWIFKTLAPTLIEVTGIEPQIRFLGAESSDSEFSKNVKHLYGLLDEAPGALGWAATFWREPPGEMIDFLSKIYENSLVISFELSPLLARALDHIGAPWIDVGISPVRFLQDNVLSFKFSAHFNGRFPDRFRLPTSTIQKGVRRVQNFYRRRPCNLPGDAVVFFAQTPIDRTLIKGGQFISADEIVGAVERVLQDRRLYLKPHPLAPESPIVRKLIQDLNGSIIDENTYAILANGKSITVATASSSVGVEARIFGLRSHTLHRKVQDWSFDGPQTLNNWATPELWVALLDGLLNTRKVRPCLKWRPNLLRDQIGGYGLDPAIWKSSLRRNSFISRFLRFRPCAGMPRRWRQGGDGALGL